MDFNEFEHLTKTLFPETDGERTERFRALGPLYTEWNSKINVISRKDMDGLYPHHVLHSLAIASYIRDEMPELYGRLVSPEGGTAATFLDLGTGGGFPGIPLAILFPGADFTLCDSVGKKILVASEVAKACGLANVRAVNARAESLGDRFDFIASRAVAPLDRLLIWVRGRYDKGVFCLKGGDVAEEIAEAMGRFRLPKGSVHVRKVDDMFLAGGFADNYFNGKLLIFIEGHKNQRK